MKKTYLTIALVCTFLQGCAKYEPVIDSVGRSGTFNEARATQITDDIIMCEKIADNNTTLLSNFNFWLTSSSMDTEYEHLVKNCLIGRGHSLLK